MTEKRRDGEGAARMDRGISPGALGILRRLNDAGYEAYLVGGCVRDLLRGGAPHDWDICTSALPEETERCFAGLRVAETGLKHGTVTVIDGGEPYEVTTWRVDGGYGDGRRPDNVRFTRSLREDLARRDFTVNAMAMDQHGGIVDPFGGQEDLRRGIVRCVGDPDRRFGEDGLRVMRALRFSSALGYAVEGETAAAIHRDRGMLGRVAAERICAELRGLLTGPGAGAVLREYPDVLLEFWPGLAQPADVWERTVRRVEAVPPETALRLAALLWDVKEDAGQMLRALKFDRATAGRTADLLRERDTTIPPEEGALCRLVSRLGGERFFSLLELRRAQCASEGGAGLAELNAAGRMAEQLAAAGRCISVKELTVDGDDLLAAGVAPGPAVGAALNALLGHVLDGTLPNGREALLAAAAEWIQTEKVPE